MAIAFFSSSYSPKRMHETDSSEEAEEGYVNKDIFLVLTTFIVFSNNVLKKLFPLLYIYIYIYIYIYKMIIFVMSTNEMMKLKESVKLP